MTATITPAATYRHKPRLAWWPLGAALAIVEVNREPLHSNAQRIARLLDVDVRQLRRWMRDGITPDVADRICFAIGRHPAELYEGWGEWT